MEKIMPLDSLSSIKGAQSSESVNALFEVIKNSQINISTNSNTFNNTVSINGLREDTVIESSESERKLIKENFPKEKNAYLVVSKVIED